MVTSEEAEDHAHSNPGIASAEIEPYRFMLKQEGAYLPKQRR